MNFFSKKLLRLILLGLVAAFTSEVLSTNLTLFSALSPLIFFFYFTHFAILDDIIARLKLDYKRIFLLGVLYGHFMEAFGARSHFENATVFVQGWRFVGINWDNVVFITFWQGLFTTVLTFLIVDSLIRKRKGSLFSKRQYILLVAPLVPLYFLIGAETPFPSLFSVLVMAAFIGVLLKVFLVFSKGLSGSFLSAKKKALLAIVLITIAIPLGFINPGYSGEDALFRLGIIFVLIGFMGVKIFRSPKPSGTNSSLT